MSYTLPICITLISPLVFANSIIDQNLVFSENTTIDLTETIESNTRFVGIGANSGSYTIQGTALNLSGSQSELPNAQRLYGIAAEEGSSLTLESNSNIQLDSSNAEIRAVRANGGDITLSGDSALILKSETGQIIGVDVWTGASVDVSGNIFSIDAQTTQGRIIAVQNWNSDGGLINFNSQKTTILSDNSQGYALNQGVLAYQSTTNFNGDVEIIVNGGSNTAYGVDVQCDPGNKYDTVVNFYGSLTKITTTGKGEAVSLRPSGVPGFINIFSDEVELLTSTEDGEAYGVYSQYGASLKILNEDAVVKISAQSENNNATAILNSTYGGNDTYQFGSVEIEGKSLELNSTGTSAYGIVNAVYEGDIVHTVSDKDGVKISADTLINTTSAAADGESVGIKAANTQNGDLAPESKTSISSVEINSVAQNGGDAYAVYLQDNAILNLGTSQLIAASDTGKSVGIFNENSVITFQAASVVKAVTALEGNGRVNIEKDASVVFDGNIDKDVWTGSLNIAGKTAYMMTEDQAIDDLNKTSGPVLLVPAGTTIAGTINVGDVDATSGNAIAIASNGTVLIKVLSDYDGMSPLVVVDALTAEEGSSVVLLNAVAVPDGTTVFAGEESDLIEDYIFSTDNLLKKVVNNKVVRESASVALAGVLAPNTVNEALTVSGLGAERVIALTTDTTADSAVKALNSIALMATAGAAQVVSVNASNMIADTLDQHGSLLASYTHEKRGADLWVDLNGSFSKASGYKAGSSSYGYKSDLAGATIGADYAFGNGVTAGAAFSIGTGSARGQGNGSGVKNDIDYWGVNLYGVWATPYVNLIGNVGYLQTKNEIFQSGYKGKPDVKTVSVGVKAEKALQLNESITVTPHVGVRYFNVDMDSFTAGGFKYSSDKANLVQVPFGVAFNANLKASCGAEVKPFIDVQVAPAFGDRKATNKFALAGGSASDSIEARIANNAMYSAKIGVEATRGNHSFGLNYGIASGNYGRVDQALQAKYRYSF